MILWEGETDAKEEAREDKTREQQAEINNQSDRRCKPSDWPAVWRNALKEAAGFRENARSATQNERLLASTKVIWMRDRGMQKRCKETVTTVLMVKRSPTRDLSIKLGRRQI